MPSHKLSKSLALKTITERMDNSTKEDDVEKEIVGSSTAKESSLPPRVISRRKMGRSLNPLKELCVSNAMAIGISRRSVLTI